MKLFHHTTLIVLFLLTFKLFAQDSVNQPDSSDVSNLPDGVSYQWGAGPHNGDWTYEYGTKLSVKHNAWRNFEIMTTSRGGGCSTFLAFRVFNADDDKWYPWRRMLIADQDGSLALGQHCSESGYMLTVNGKVLAEEINVQTVPGSDYVFEPNYKLRPIEDVEAFVKENKHLPDIPSAEEFKENGVGLGEMDNMLLRKVEELTLYVIEQNEKIEKLEKENKKLRKEKDKDIRQLRKRINKLEQK